MRALISDTAGRSITWPKRTALAVALAALCLLLFLPGFFSLPPMDRDEARFAQATRQMLESRDFVDIRFQGEARHKKPVGIYWMQSAAVTLAGGPEQAAIWAYRLPSLIGATLAVLLTFWVGSSLFGPVAGFIGAVMLAGTVLLGVEARTAKTDAALFATILAAQGVLASIWLRRDMRDGLGLGSVLLFWTALGVGILLKGPIILLVTGGTVLWLSVAQRGIGWLAPLRPKLGLSVMLALVAPWLILITIKTNGSFFAESVGHDMMAKVAGGQESKGFPPGYYTLLFPVTFWPWSLLALPAFPWVWNNRRDPAVLFCLAWIVPSWLVFEAVPTKLFHYILPTYAAFALLTARAVLDGFGKARCWLTGAATVLFAVTALALTGAMAAVPIMVEKRFDPLSILLALVTLAVLAYGVVLYRREWLRRSVAALTAGAFGLYLLAFQVVFPQLETIWLSPRIAEAVERVRPCPDSVLVSAGFTEPSLVFLTGTGTVLTGDGAAAAKALAGDACALALVDQRQNQAFLDQAVVDNIQPVPTATISGFNYSRGRSLVLSLYRR